MAVSTSHGSYLVLSVRSLRDGYFETHSKTNFQVPSYRSLFRFSDTAVRVTSVSYVWGGQMYLYDRDGIVATGRPIDRTYAWYFTKDGVQLGYNYNEYTANLSEWNSLYLGDGMYINIPYDGNANAMPELRLIPMNPASADAVVTHTTTYGWDGSAWVKGVATGKPCHLTEQPAAWPGVNVKFTDSATNPAAVQYAATESYACVLYQGVFSDNATKTELISTSYMNLSNVVAGRLTVPAATDSVGVLPWITTQDDEIYDTGGGAMTTRGEVGELHIHWRNTPMVGPAWSISMDTSGCAAADSYNGSASDKDVFRLQVVAGETGNQPAGARPDATLTSPVKMSYDGASVKWGVGSVTNRSWSIPASAAIPAFIVPQRTLAGKLPTISIVTNGSACLVKIGSAAANNGTFRDSFITVDNLSPENWVNLDGVNIPIRYDNNAPAPGECCIPYLSGVIILNAADAGKAVSYNLRCCYLE